MDIPPIVREEMSAFGGKADIETTALHPAEDFVPFPAPMNHGLETICRNAMFPSARFSEYGRNLPVA
jgi:hypothetical protein